MEHDAAGRPDQGSFSFADSLHDGGITLKVQVVPGPDGGWARFGEVIARGLSLLAELEVTHQLTVTVDEGAAHRFFEFTVEPDERCTAYLPGNLFLDVLHELDLDDELELVSWGWLPPAGAHDDDDGRFQREFAATDDGSTEAAHAVLEAFQLVYGVPETARLRIEIAPFDGSVITGDEPF